MTRREYGHPVADARLLVSTTSTLAVLPIMLAAHWATARQIPEPMLVLIVGLAVFVTILVLPWRGRRSLTAAVGAGQLAGQFLLGWLGPATGRENLGCLPLVGRGADLGLRLALVRPDSSCPHGTLAGTGALVFIVGLLAAAISVLLVHFSAAVLAARGALVIQGACDFARRLWVRLTVSLRHRLAPVSPSVILRIHPVPERARSLWTHAPALLRGPPLTA
jgi:hypothetical protein